jgi:hypothetical protein
VIKKYGLPLSCFKDLSRELVVESDRGRLLLAGIYVELFLRARFFNEETKSGSLFEMLRRARANRWIEEDVFHDADIIRKLRNGCAHESGRVEMNEDDIRDSLERFRVPRRCYFDWGQIRAASTESGFVLYSGERPENAVSDLVVPGTMTFSAAIGIILYVLASNLEVPFAIENSKTAVLMELPPFMQLASN